jgi:hypothetical protein
MNKTNLCTEAVHNLVNTLGRLTKQVLKLLDRFMVIVVTQVKFERLLHRPYSVRSFPVTCL